MDVEFAAPVFCHLSDALRAVIEGQEQWCMAFSDDRIKDVQGLFCGDGTCSRSGERLSGEFISHV